MTQTSYFWNGTTLGDATIAPYSDNEISSVIEGITGNFVVPGYLAGSPVAGPVTELNVAGDPGNVGEVTVSPGAAMVHGTLYILDEETNLTIDATPAANPAIYRIILTRDAVNQDVRVSVSKGTDAAVPSPPVVAADEFTLAWIWVSGAYNPAVDLVSDNDIHDERVFKYIGPDARKHKFENILHNAEFYGFSGGPNSAPDGWILVNAPTTSQAGGNRVSRGYSLRIQHAGANQGIQTTVPINLGTSANELPDTWTIRGFIEVDGGSLDINVYGQILGGGSALYASKTFNRVATPTAVVEGIAEFIIRLRVNPAATTINAWTIQIVTSGAANDGYIGALAVVPGYLSGNHATNYKSDVIMFDNALTDAAWTSTAKSTGTTVISLNGSFGGIFFRGTKGIIAKLRCRDSGSAAAAVDNGTSLQVYHVGQLVAANYIGAVSCAGLPNDSWAERVVLIPIDPADSNVRFSVVVAASGAGTLDATIEILGCIT